MRTATPRREFLMRAIPRAIHARALSSFIFSYYFPRRASCASATGAIVGQISCIYHSNCLTKLSKLIIQDVFSPEMLKKHVRLEGKRTKFVEPVIFSTIRTIIFNANLELSV